MHRAAGAHELMDGPLPEADLAASLADLDRLNRWFRGYALSVACIRRAAAAVPRSRPMTVIDVGGGHGDFAVHLVRWARTAGRRVRVIVVDRDAARVARARQRGYPEILAVAGDAAALPLREAAADVVTLSLTLHHLEPGEAAAALAELAVAARQGIVVNDLRRGYLSLALVWLATRLLGMHPVSRHDGLLSVRRAYSADEVRALAEKAGLRRITIVSYPMLGRLVALLS
ncbi:MAG TPA: methyltransferase domain-containing protein [Candidatus Limnocylindria bacterium]|nr:methyltransferase domain-containing protein [Candidatus Limnocylindria bacterium]